MEDQNRRSEPRPFVWIALIVAAAAALVAIAIGFWHRLQRRARLAARRPAPRPPVIPVEGLFHKVVMVRDRLRVLEAKINGHTTLSDAEKVELQQYVSRCYGSLTTFNVLFKNREDRFSSK